MQSFVCRASTLGSAMNPLALRPCETSLQYRALTGCVENVDDSFFVALGNPLVGIPFGAFEESLAIHDRNICTASALWIW